MAERGEYRDSELISTFSSSLQPFFMRKITIKKSQQPEDETKAVDEVENDNKNFFDEFGYSTKQPEIIGGENITPRKVDPKYNQTTPSGFIYDPVPYEEKNYKGSDFNVMKSINMSSRDFNKKIRINRGNLSSSTANLRTGYTNEDVINRPTKVLGGYGYQQQHRNRMNYIRDNMRTMNNWGTYEEPLLAPQDDIETDSQYFF